MKLSDLRKIIMEEVEAALAELDERDVEADDEDLDEMSTVSTSLAPGGGMILPMGLAPGNVGGVGKGSGNKNFLKVGKPYGMGSLPKQRKLKKHKKQ